MPKFIPENELQALEKLVAAHTGGISIGEIEQHSSEGIPRRTLQYRLKYLVDHNRLLKVGEKRGSKYRVSPLASASEQGVREPSEETYLAELTVSRTAADIRQYVQSPVLQRTPVGYDREFLDAYRPNETTYLSEQEREQLRAASDTHAVGQPAGTFARQLLDRLLIDLSWNSSRLEGNTYALLDTRRLIEFGEEAEGKESLDAQMILNHKDAIEFLVESSEQTGFNRQTILNLHALLANNLLSNPQAMGGLRKIAVGIGKSVYHPLEVPQLIEECFYQILSIASEINDPYEQALFIMAQLPYLQPFEDVNKRVSRLAANIPLIKENLCPLSFVDVPRSLYIKALLGVYELNQVDLLKEVFIWAYHRSAARYTMVRQVLGQPDPFRLKHRDSMREIVREIVAGCLDRKAAYRRIVVWTAQHVEEIEQEQFRETVETELLSLHEGNYARFQLSHAQFSAWQEVWNP